MGRILLTGGAGFIGSHTYVELVAAGHEVVIVDNFSNARRDVIDRLEVITEAPVLFHEGDVLDKRFLEDVFRQHDFDAVIHFAAKKAVGESVEQPLLYFQTNCTGFATLLGAMKDARVFRIVFSSTATVYGNPVSLPCAEDHPIAPLSPYAHSKVTCETLLRQLKESDDRWAYGILRYFNPAGAHDSALIGEDPNDIPNNLMPYIAKVATGELPHLNVFGNDYDTPDGTGIRDYIHVVDLARGHVQSVNKLIDEDDSHVLNLGTGTGYSVMDMLRSYEKACGKELPYKIAPRRAGDIDCFFADPALARDYLGFEAQRGLDEMCRSSWNWVSRLRNR
ncbi:UDP-glucose 4-epimerase GalE [Maritimibacter sp. UBA3975]|uniref:UDP-glucose 4-epimerase GalE n=1 Tax=Maritimibacter sp. UBA3975 TaxID=1946833 RepID=UPI000C0ABCFC|nr:UDP-glucose 4-epimerase GalE [Maritimibacter sp. UBA3975]MAM63428.1 UDP-glucose 4-epimerase GalE [Maritimibacter sp.]|tara:strand:- start:50174 stop:51181 length:1008 start_codon:yes stop_codon:yes gene_type:complete